MASTKHVDAAREQADREAARWFTDVTLSTNDPGICGMLEAVRLEIRALAEVLDVLRKEAL